MRFVSVVIPLMLLSCVTSSPESSIERHMQLRHEYLTTYYSSYAYLREQAIDSLREYIKDSLTYVAPQLYYGGWQVDSVFLFNSDSTRFYTKLHGNSSVVKHDPADSYDDFGGALIDGKWYFFKMGTFTVVPRGHYHHDPYEPLTFEELSYIAWRGRIPGLIYRQEDGSIATNHKAIDQMFFSTDRVYCPDPDSIVQCKEFRIIDNLQHSKKFKLNKEEILRIQKDIHNSKKPYVPPYKELTWWDRLWGKEDLLFDSKAWKERYDYKKEEERK